MVIRRQFTPRRTFSLLPHSSSLYEGKGKKVHFLHPEIGCLVNSEEGCKEEGPLRTKQEAISFGYGSPETDH